MTEARKLFAVVALLEAIPAANLRHGQVGTIVETLDDNFYEVEFGDDGGRAYATVPVEASQLLLLHYAPTKD